MARTDAFPRAKALVQEAALDTPGLKGGAAFRMLEKIQKRELNQVADGKLIAKAGEIPLEIPTSEKTPARWIAELPPYKIWDADTASPAEFQVVARVFSELTAKRFLTRMFTQDEAEKIGRYGLIIPDFSAVQLWGLARAAIIMEANKIPLESLNAWLMYHVPPQREHRGNTLDKRMRIYRQSAGKLFPEFPDIYMRLPEMDEQPVPSKNLVPDVKGTE